MWEACMANLWIRICLLTESRIQIRTVDPHRPQSAAALTSPSGYSSILPHLRSYFEPDGDLFSYLRQSTVAGLSTQGTQGEMLKGGHQTDSSCSKIGKYGWWRMHLPYCWIRTHKISTYHHHHYHYHYHFHRRQNHRLHFLQLTFRSIYRGVC